MHTYENTGPYLLKKAQTREPSQLIERNVHSYILHITFHNFNLPFKIPSLSQIKLGSINFTDQQNFPQLKVKFSVYVN